MTNEMKQFNDALETFDRVTDYRFDRVTDLERLAAVAEAHNWHDLAKQFRHTAKTCPQHSA